MARLAGAAECTTVLIVLAVAAVALSGQGKRLRAFLAVACMAGNRRMGPRQLELCLGCVVEPPKRPAVGIMALLARGAEPSIVMGVLMTCIAGSRGALELLRQMTALARDSGVKTYQGKTGQVVIEVNSFTPALLVVTALAARAELTLMRIVLLVARDAVGLQFVGVEVAGVASAAEHLAVLSAQWKLGCLVVVEANGCPTLRRVAGLAFCAVSAAMRIAEPVATHAGGVNTLPLLGGMAGPASNVLVCASEREFGLAVVEGLGAAPGIG